MFTNFYATLCIYQNAFMCISEPRTNLTLINGATKVYELE